jgi:Glycosyltransferase Family 4
VQHDQGRLRVAIVAPPWYTVPPAGYGGINQQVYLMARGLHALGHEVTVFCREGSRPEGYEIITAADPNWSADEVGADYEIRYLVYLTRVYDRLRADRFDGSTASFPPRVLRLLASGNLTAGRPGRLPPAGKSWCQTPTSCCHCATPSGSRRPSARSRTKHSPRNPPATTRSGAAPARADRVARERKKAGTRAAGGGG